MQAPKSGVKSLSHFDCSKQLSHPLLSCNFLCSPLTTNALRNGNEQVGEILAFCHPSSAMKKQKGVSNPVDVVRKGSQTLALTLSLPRHKTQQHSPFTRSIPIPKGGQTWLLPLAGSLIPHICLCWQSPKQVWIQVFCNWRILIVTGVKKEINQLCIYAYLSQYLCFIWRKISFIWTNSDFNFLSVPFFFFLIFIPYQTIQECKKVVCVHKLYTYIHISSALPTWLCSPSLRPSAIQHHKKNHNISTKHSILV